MLRNIVSEREKDLPKLTIGKLLKIAAEDKSVISLGPGEPDFTAPGSIIAAARRALERGMTHYSPVGGRTDFKEAVIRKLKRDNKILAGPENVVVTCGSTEGILLSLMCVIDPGEGVFVPDPGFLAYTPSIETLNGVPVPYRLLESRGFLPDVDEMKKDIIPEKTRAIIINTPSNPTGAVFSRKVLEEIADFARENNLLVISDEAYEKFVYDNVRHVSIGSLNGMDEYVMTLHSFSKTYAMPGFRLGYACGPEKIVKAMTKLHIFTTLCAPTVSQVAGISALKGTQAPVERMRKEYDRRRVMVVRRLNEIVGFRCVKPRGAFYAFPNITAFRMGSYDFAEALLRKAGVAVVPGTEFGRAGEGFVRISYATEYGLIEKALERIEGFVKTLRF